MSRTIKIILFSLIGFFVLAMVGFFLVTASVSAPVMMEMTSTKADTVYRLDTAHTVTLLIDKNDSLFCFDSNKQIQCFAIGDIAIRKFLLAQRARHGDSLFVAIKTLKGASYKSSVDMLDEMAINEIRNYAMIEVDENDIVMVEKFKTQKKQ